VTTGGVAAAAENWALAGDDGSRAAKTQGIQMSAAVVDSKYEDWMRVALRVSREATPGCLPNPPVGCVLVSGSRILASGFTDKPGGPHAERCALSKLASVPRGTAAFVTLEPCSFHGRTPPCTDAIIDAGILEVHVALIDPDPRNNGRGLDLLRQAGATVHVGLLADEVDAFLRPFLIRERGAGAG